MYERLVLGHVVGGGEVDLQRVSEFVAFGRGEDDAGSQAGAHLDRKSTRLNSSHWMIAGPPGPSRHNIGSGECQVLWQAGARV